MSVSDSSSTDPKAFVAKNGYTWTFGAADEAFKAYEVSIYPTTLFIDRQGNVKVTQPGGMSKAEFEANLAQIL